MRKPYILQCAFLIVLLCRQAPAQVGGPQRESFLLTDKEAIGVLPPEVAAAGGVEWAKWSSDGRFVLMRRTAIRFTPDVLKGLLTYTLKTPPGEVAITVWDNVAHKAQDVWKRPMGKGNVERLEWLPGSSVALAIVDTTEPAKTPNDPPETRRGILRINAETGITRVVLDQPQTYFWQLDSSPSKPFAILRHDDPEYSTETQADGKVVQRIKAWNHMLAVIQESGVICQPMRVPDGLVLAEIAWSQQGDSILHCMDWPRQPKQKPVPRYLSLDVRTGSMKPYANTPDFYKRPPDGLPIRLKSSSTIAKEGDISRTLPTLWLESVTTSSQPRAFVAADAQEAELSPSGESVLYRSNGAAWVAQLIRMSKEDYAKIVEQALRTVALSKGKQLGLAAMMYAQDYDEVLPGASADINGKLEPYLQTNALFDGFVYTFAGGALKDIGEPSTTELGYVMGPGGRAVIFADGHVTWRSDK